MRLFSQALDTAGGPEHHLESLVRAGGHGGQAQAAQGAVGTPSGQPLLWSTAHGGEAETGRAATWRAPERRKAPAPLTSSVWDHKGHAFQVGGQT